MIDGHIHFPVNSANPYKDFCAELLRGGVYQFLLILNTQKEKEIFINHIDELKNNYDFGIAIGLDIHNSCCIDEYNIFRAKGCSCSVKLHPRIAKITKQDFTLVYKIVSQLDCKAIIVDDWLFGPQIENHIGTELAIFLAKKLPHKRIVIAHSGGIRILETMMLTRNVDNIFYDLALTCKYFDDTSLSIDIEHFIRYTSKRIVFGSDYPDFSISESYQALRKHCERAKVALDDIEHIFNELGKDLYL